MSQELLPQPLQILLPGDEAVTSQPQSLPAAASALNTALEQLVAGRLSPLTRKAYRQDAAVFVKWLAEQGLELEALRRSDIERYQVWLIEHYTKNAAARKLVVVRRLLVEAVERGMLATNPAQKVRGVRADQETPHVALKVEEARQLLAAIDTSSLQGKRDYAIVSLLLRTGLRRSECAALRLADLQEEQGHHLAVLQHAKGNKRRKVKIPVDVWRSIEEYLQGLGIESKEQGQIGFRFGEDTRPVFVQFRRGDHPQTEGISDQVVQKVVERACEKAGLNHKLTPHALRATFVTLALEGGAKLEQVQYAVGHADPRTTERYQNRKLNLDNHAVDYVKLD